MKKNELMSKLSGTISQLRFHVKKHSPEILIVAGVVGTVASAVMACRATIKARDVLESSKHDLECVHKCIDGEVVNGDYTEEDGKKDLALVYVKTGIELAKLYLPAISLGAASIVSILASNNILRQRNVAIAAAYATVDRGFKDYRSRLVERFGDEIDKELRYNIKAREIEETIIDENGEEQIVKRTVKTADVDPYADYSRFFDDTCFAWDRDPEYNRLFLKSQQSTANDRLQAHGYLFLNEVYDMLGMPKTKAGQVVGWVYDKTNKSVGDNYVDFGIYEVANECSGDFNNGYGQFFVLDFNVDGYILDRVVKNNLLTE